MSPSLDSLRDHGVDAHRYRCLGLLNGSNLNQHLEPPRVRLFDERRRIAPKQQDRGRSFLSRDPKLGLEKPPVLLEVRCAVFGHDDVDPEGATRQCPDPLDLGSDRVWRHAARSKDAKPAGMRDGSDELPREHPRRSRPRGPATGDGRNPAVRLRPPRKWEVGASDAMIFAGSASPFSRVARVLHSGSGARDQPARASERKRRDHAGARPRRDVCRNP
jgi:hypothetical protein